MIENFNFISIKDPHFMFGFEPPRQRIKYIFEKDIDSKIDFIIDYGVKNNINILILTGDIFEVYKSSKWNFSQHFLENKKRLLKLKKQFTIYSIAGNHDFLDGNENINNSIFQELVELKIIKYFNNKSFKFLNKLKNKTIEIHGVDYFKQREKVIEKIQNINNSIQKDINEEYHIIMLHSNVLPGKAKTSDEFFVSDFTYGDLLKYNKINMWLLGHFHKGYPTEKKDNVYFINNWNLTRIAATNYVLEEEHTPEFEDVKINFNDFNDVLTKTIKIPIRSFKESFVTTKEEKKEIIIDEIIDVKLSNLTNIKHGDKKNELQILEELSVSLKKEMIKNINNEEKYEILKENLKDEEIPLIIDKAYDKLKKHLD